jgi:hypothetical protein
MIGPQRLSQGGNRFYSDILDYKRKKASPIQFKALKSIKNYYYDQLAEYKAFVLLPYSIHSYGMLELRKMNIPLFVPSIKLLSEYEIKYNILNERRSEIDFGNQRTDGLLSPSKGSVSLGYNPNNDLSEYDLTYWLQFSDFYKWPTIRFDSISDLFDKLEKTDFKKQSQIMEEYNENLRIEVNATWNKVIDHLFDDKPPGSWPIPETHEDGMKLWSKRWKKYNPSWKVRAKNGNGKGTKWMITLSEGDCKPDNEWITVIVVGPERWNIANCTYLDYRQTNYKMTHRTYFETSKNIGFLYAIENGASVIHDADTGETYEYRFFWALLDQGNHLWRKIWNRKFIEGKSTGDPFSDNWFTDKTNKFDILLQFQRDAVAQSIISKEQCELMRYWLLDLLDVGYFIDLE